MKAIDYADQCGREWSSKSLVDEPGSRAQLGPVAHKCRRLDGHSSAHACSCGAQLDERLPIEL